MIESVIGKMMNFTSYFAAAADAIAQDGTQAADFTLSMLGTTIISATVGAGFSILILLLKEWLLPIWKRKHEKRQTDADIYMHYLGPLCVASEKITWRMREVYVQKRHSFLKIENPQIIFNEYKRVSTLYRIACLIGMIRGMNLELSSHRAHNPTYSPPISKEIAGFQSALADGISVEKDRLKNICRLWQLELKNDHLNGDDSLPFEFENEVYRILESKEIKPTNCSTLVAKEKLSICQNLAEFLCEKLGVAHIPDKLIKDNVDTVIGHLHYREALLFRDWQDALGDSLIERDTSAVRRFRIIGFSAFTDLLESANKPWVEVFKSSIDDMDLEKIDPQDFRAHQLQRVARASAALLIAINKTQTPSPANPDAVQAAKEILDCTAAPN